MTASASKRILRVFLASPSDLVPERTKAHAVIGRLNQTLGDSGWYIELLRWEHALPGYGRPQEQINEYVDNCDLFVGVLWSRWGSATGSHSSGFEEEYERASSRRRASDLPEIWMYLKKIDTAQASDPGDQLSAVLAFREKLQLGRELLYGEFGTTEEWEQVFHDALLRHLLKIMRDEPGDSESGAPTRPVAEDSQAPRTELDDVHGRDVVAALAVVGAKVGADSTILVTKDRSHVLRALLYSSTLVQQIGGDALGNHSIHLIYRERGVLRLVDAERYYLIRSMLHEGNKFSPGWYWLPSDLLKMRLVLSHFATEDADAAIRRAGVEALVHFQLRDDVALIAMLKDDATEVVDAAAEYMLATPEANDWQLFIEVFERLSWSPRKRVIASLLGRLEAMPSDRALEFVRRYDGPFTNQMATQLAPFLAGLPDTELQTLRSHRSAGVKAAVSAQLMSRSLMDEAEAASLVKEAPKEIKFTVVRAMIRAGLVADAEAIRGYLRGADDAGFGFDETEDVDSTDDVVKFYFATKSDDELAGIVEDFASVDGPLAYAALADRNFVGLQESIRAKLSDEFKTDWTRALDRARNELSGANAEPLLTKFEDIGTYLRAQYCEVALGVLKERGSCVDLGVARKFIDSDASRLRRLASGILGRWGEAQDAEAMITLARAEYGARARSIALDALAISATPWEDAVACLRDGGSALVEAATITMLGPVCTPATPAGLSDLRDLLYSEKANVRTSVAEVVIHHECTADLEMLLNDYTEKTRYYYDVVVLLDRAVYGPGRRVQASPESGVS